MYGWWCQIGSSFAGAEEFQAVAMRYDRTDANFAAGIHPVAGVVRGNMIVNRPWSPTQFEWRFGTP